MHSHARVLVVAHARPRTRVAIAMPTLARVTHKHQSNNFADERGTGAGVPQRVGWGSGQRQSLLNFARNSSIRVYFALLNHPDRFYLDSAQEMRHAGRKAGRMSLDLDIDLDGILPKGGRRGLPTGSKRRNLSDADMVALANVKSGDLQQALVPIAKIRSTHHMLARLLADGKKITEVALVSGYDNAYISNLQNDSAFKELIAYYQSQQVEIYTSVHERMANLSMLAAEELQDRLTTEPEEFKTRELLEVLEKTADRTGFGPQSRNVNVNVNLDMASRLSQARKRAGLEIEKPTLDLQPIKEST